MKLKEEYKRSGYDMNLVRSVWDIESGYTHREDVFKMCNVMG
jgi:hypothetical protein